MNNANKTEARDAQKAALVQLALGRIFALGSRPTQPGDVAEYERCRAIVMENAS
jgi:hypothetical protein